jgi:photosystem II stability/assembly factor-like uncharacterized protein
MTRLALTLLVVVAVACTPAASAPSPTPTAAASSAAPATQAPSATPATPPTASPTPIALPTVAYIAAAGNGVVWVAVAGTRLFESSDRGATWGERSVPQSGGIQEIAFVSADEGWILGVASPATQCQSQGVRLWHTSDGARTWQQLSVSGIADAQCKDRLAFVDAQRGYLGAHDPNSAPVIYRTTDGGKTWSASARLPDPPGFTSGGGGFTLSAGPVADFGSTQYLYASGNNNSQLRAYIFRSTNGGASWSFATTPPANDAGVVFVTATRFIEIGTPGTSSESTDGGVTWHPFTSDYSQAAPVAPQIVFGDANVGYATVRGSIQRTTDGGAHWTAIKTPGT